MISIIVPVYNVESYLHQCIDSILNQSYTDYEVILVDDGSSDQCGIICDAYAKRDHRVRVFHIENRGLSAARNLGIKESKGDYIGFVDPDDWIEPDMYEVLLEIINDTGADACMCGLWFETSTTSVVSNTTEAIYYGEKSICALLDDYISNVLWNKLFHRSLFEAVFFPEGHNYEDIARMHLILGKAKKISVTNAPMYHYRQRSEGISKSDTTQNLIDYSNALIARYHYLKKEHETVFLERREEIVLPTVKSISRVWYRWQEYGAAERQKYKGTIREYKLFIRDNIPYLGNPSWPTSLRIMTLFMHSDSVVSFVLLHLIIKLHKKCRFFQNNC